MRFPYAMIVSMCQLCQRDYQIQRQQRGINEYTKLPNTMAEYR